MSYQKGGIVIVTSFLLAFVLLILPLPEWARYYRPQWHTLVLIYWALATPQRVGVGVGWLVGIAVDVITGTLLGQHALALSLIAYITQKMHQRLRLFPVWQQSLTILVLLLIEKLINMWIMGAISQPVPSLLFWVPPFVGMIIWPWIFFVLRDLRHRFQVS
ncbi:MAG: rod shape-determining protein MreD [Gammaproteobacteria bacterium]|nr:rod shape-determining protein MreD [Gammaproteobacteria bacterium]